MRIDSGELGECARQVRRVLDEAGLRDVLTIEDDAQNGEALIVPEPSGALRTPST